MGFFTGFESKVSSLFRFDIQLLLFIILLLLFLFSYS